MRGWRVITPTDTEKKTRHVPGVSLVARLSAVAGILGTVGLFLIDIVMDSGLVCASDVAEQSFARFIFAKGDSLLTSALLLCLLEYFSKKTVAPLGPAVTYSHTGSFERMWSTDFVTTEQLEI